ncbi:MAG: hypothetical protein VYE22_09435 [Myxococcota bacterium]|nr:hypothetical protein [Myxococcota bacterium]
MSFLPWVFTFFGVLIGAAYVGVGATVVRAAKPQAGYLLIAAGALEIVLVCCTAVAFRVVEVEFGGAAGMALMLLSTLEKAVFGVLLAVAAVMLANSIREDAPPS